MLHGSKRSEVLTLADIKRYGLDSFADVDYISIYGMPPEEWYRRGIRVLGRTAVECTRDALGDRVGLDVASVAKRMPSNEFVVIDPFAGSCNTLFWILRHLPNSEGIGFESDQQVFALTHRNLAAIRQRIDLVHGEYAALLKDLHVPHDRSIVAFVAPPWGTALDEVNGLDLCRTTPPITEVIDQIARQFSGYSRYPSHFASFGQFGFDQRVLIDAPDLHSDQQNAIRWWILAAERGYGIGVSLFTGFPYDVAWRRVALEPTDFWRLRYGKHDNWIKLSEGTRRVLDGAENIDLVVLPNDTNDLIRAVAAQVKAGKKYAELIGAAGEGDDVILIEGHVRATAYALAQLPDRMECIVGASPAMRNWIAY